MEIKDGWCVAGALLIFAFATFMGFSMGRSSVFNDCRDFSAAVKDGQRIECRHTNKAT